MPTDPEADGLREEAAYTPPPATQWLIDELFREEIIQARKLSPVEKALAGQRLFESACRITLAGTASVSRGIGRGMRGNPA